MRKVNNVFLIGIFILSSLSINAQNVVKPVLRQPAFTTSEVSNNKQKTILEEIYEIEDERFRIEKNDKLSPTERTSMINEVNNQYNIKKQEFISYVNSKGFSNILEKEQFFYLSLLKEDGKMDEYKKYIGLLKNSK